jgi:hypothetical protein
MLDLEHCAYYTATVEARSFADAMEKATNTFTRQGVGVGLEFCRIDLLTQPGGG